MESQFWSIAQTIALSGHDEEGTSSSTRMHEAGICICIYIFFKMSFNCLFIRIDYSNLLFVRLDYQCRCCMAFCYQINTFVSKKKIDFQFADFRKKKTKFEVRIIIYRYILWCFSGTCSWYTLTIIFCLCDEYLLILISLIMMVHACKRIFISQNLPTKKLLLNVNEHTLERLYFYNFEHNWIT